jgi:hypothetical protein
MRQLVDEMHVTPAIANATVQATPKVRPAHLDS